VGLVRLKPACRAAGSWTPREVFACIGDFDVELHREYAELSAHDLPGV
jgi:hypothetical protein